MNPKKNAVIFCAAFLFSQTLGAAQWSSKNDLTLESRVFENDHLDYTHDHGEALFFRSENRYVKDNFTASLRGYGRAAAEDSSRNIAAFEDAWVMYRPALGWSFKAGIETLTWTATEGFHPADIINSINYDSNLENPEKLGELLVSARKDIGLGNLTLFYFPDVVEPQLADASSRLSFLQAGYAYSNPVWFDGAGEERGAAKQWGARFEQTIGGADISVHYVDHYDRQQPVYFDAGLDARGNYNLRPLYLKTRNFGLTYVQVFDALIVKVEHNYKDFYTSENKLIQFSDELSLGANYGIPKSHHQLAAGLEYSIYHDSGKETSLYFEGQMTSGLDEEERRAALAFQRDVLIGFRHALNDIMGREFVLTAIIDAETSSEYILTFSYRQRLTNVVSLNAGIRLIEAEDGSGFGGLAALKNSDHIFLNITYHF